MKKLVLILVCAALLTFFISFNYLLWDREKSVQSIQDLEYSNDSKDATIGALGREIKNLEDNNRQLTSKLKLVEDENKSLVEKVSKLEENIHELESRIVQDKNLINALKLVADFSPLESAIKDWIIKINEGRYEEAYRLTKLKTDAGDKPLSLSDFADSYKNSVKSMELKSVELAPDEAMLGNKADIIFLVELNVARPKESSEGKFKEGLNKMYFGFEYDTELKSWFISAMDVAS